MVWMTLEEIMPNKSGEMQSLAQGVQGGLRICVSGKHRGMSVPLVLSPHFE